MGDFSRIFWSIFIGAFCGSIVMLLFKIFCILIDIKCFFECFVEVLKAGLKHSPAPEVTEDA